MKNVAIVVILGIALAICSYAMFDSRDKYFEYLAVEKTFSDDELNLDKNDSVSFLSQYSIEDLRKNYPKPTVLFNKTIIDVPVVNQYPELPVGCEIASSTALLNYIGIDIDKMTLLNDYFETDYEFISVNKYSRKGPDPNEVFVGDPTESGFGCFPPAVEKFIDNYFNKNGYNYDAIQLKNANEKDLETLIDNGIPVMVWATVNMRPYKFTTDNKWILNTTGERFRWPGNSHVLILAGYDDKSYYFSDCNDKDEIVYYKKSDFLQRWNQNDCKGIIIKL